MKKVIILPVGSGHINSLVDKLLKIYSPFSFVFIGSNGFYVRQVAEKISEKLNGETINRGAFKVITQFMEEVLRKRKMEAVTVRRDFFRVFASNIISEIVEGEREDEKYREFVRPLLSSPRGIESLVDLIERYRELDIIDELTKEYEDVKAIKESESDLRKLIEDIKSRFEENLERKKRVYDSVSVYKWFFEENFEKFGKIVAISGFFDITPLTKKFFKKLFTLFDNVYFFLPEFINDRAFESLDELKEFLEKENFEFEDSFEKAELEKYLEKVNISFKKYPDYVLEMENIAKDIKKKIISGIYPEDISVTVPSQEIAFELAEVFEDYGIPYRFAGDVPLSESKIVKVLLQPLKTIYNNYSPDDILAMIEAGYSNIEVTSLTLEEIHEIFQELGFFYESNLYSSKTDWKRRIEERIELLINLKDQVEDEEVSKGYESRIEKLEELVILLNNVFQEIEKVKQYYNSEDPSWYRKLLYEYIHEKKIINKGILSEYLKDVKELEKEIEALKKFESFLADFENVYKMLELKDLKLENFYRILQNSLEVETFRISERLSGTVSIYLPEDSRFVTTKYRYVISFSENYYPKFAFNPLILNSIKDEEKRSQAFLREEAKMRRNILLSILKTENLFLSYPFSTLEGEPINPSPYILDLIKEIPTEEFDTEKEIIVLDPKNIYSEKEKKLYVSYIKGRKEKPENQEIKDWASKIVEIPDTFSYTKLQNLIFCPFRYYLNYIANVKIFKKEEAQIEGILKHKIMEKYFGEHSKDWKNYECQEIKLEKYIKDIWQEFYKSSIYEEEMIKEMLLKKLSREACEVINSMRKEIELKKRKKVIAKIDIEKIKDREKNIEFEIDIGKKTVIFKNKIDAIAFGKINDTQGTMIIDYKNSKKPSVFIEQLILYLMGIMKNGEYDSDTYYLMFLPLKKDNDSLKLLLVEYNKNEDKLGFKNPYSIKNFKVYLKNILSNMDNISFIPTCALENKIFPTFIDYEKEKLKSYSSEKSFRGYCPYQPICQILWDERLRI